MGAEIKRHSKVGSAFFSLISLYQASTDIFAPLAAPILATLSAAMMSRTPSFTSGRKTPSFRVNAFAIDVQHYVQQEAVVEGVLHVSSAQAHSCLQRFEDLQHLGDAPELPALSTVLTGALPHAAPTSGVTQAVLDPSTPSLIATSSLGERVLQEAFCLASPAENPVDDDGVLRRTTSFTASTNPNVSRNNAANSTNSSTHRLAGSTDPVQVQSRTPSSSSNTTATTQEAVQRLEVAAGQHVACSDLSPEALRGSEALARSRRRKLLHLMRSTLAARDGIFAALHSTDAAHQLAAFGSSLASLISWDDDGSEVRAWDDEGCSQYL